jgi:hypothetical protein
MILLSDPREYTSELYLDEEEKKKIHVFAELWGLFPRSYMAFLDFTVVVA